MMCAPFLLNAGWLPTLSGVRCSCASTNNGEEAQKVYPQKYAHNFDKRKDNDLNSTL